MKSNSSRDRSTVILKTGSTFEELARREGDFEDWTRAHLGVDEVRVVDARAESALPPAHELDGVVVTGSPDMVTERAPWMLAAALWLRGLVHENVPVLGICFGHQLLAEALGGEVGWLPGGREIGTLEVAALPDAEGDVLLGSLPGKFVAHLSHAQTVLRLPPGARVLARSAVEPHQAVRYAANAWGVQFHPEFSEDVMRTYLERHRSELSRVGIDVDERVRSVRASEASRVLATFGALGHARKRRR